MVVCVYEVHLLTDTAVLRKIFYHWGMSSEAWHYRRINQIPEEDEPILRPTSHMGISVRKAAIHFVRLKKHTKREIDCINN